jgi:hypothetical protein
VRTKRSADGSHNVTISCPKKLPDGKTNPVFSHPEVSIDVEARDFLNLGPRPCVHLRVSLVRETGMSWLSQNVRALAAGPFHGSSSGQDGTEFNGDIVSKFYELKHSYTELNHKYIELQSQYDSLMLD